ncbi:1358_t:CDS:2, partial [Cetraspora pellucida]
RKNQDPVEWIEFLHEHLLPTTYKKPDESDTILKQRDNVGTKVRTPVSSELLHFGPNQPMKYQITNKTAMCRRNCRSICCKHVGVIQSRPFILNTFKEAINRARTCKMIFAREMSVCRLALYHQLAYASTQAPISPLHQPMYPVNQPVAPAQPLNASIKQVMAYYEKSTLLESENVQPTTNLFIAKIEEAYMAKRKHVDEEPTEVEPSPRNSYSNRDIQVSKQASNQKSEQGNSKKVMKRTSDNGKNPAILDNNKAAKQKG